MGKVYSGRLERIAANPLNAARLKDSMLNQPFRFATSKPMKPLVQFDATNLCFTSYCNTVDDGTNPAADVYKAMPLLQLSSRNQLFHKSVAKLDTA